MGEDDEGEERLDLLRRPVPAGFEVRVVVIDPGDHLAYDPETWSDSLVEVDCGEVELDFGNGRGLTLTAGDVFWLAGLGARAIHNRTEAPAVLAGVRRRVPGGQPRPYRPDQP